MFLVIFALASAAMAFDPTAHGNRVGVLDLSARYDAPDADIAMAIERRLSDELRSRGLDAFEVRAQYSQLQRFEPANADYYVEITGGSGSATPIGNVSLGTRNVVADIGLIVSHVAAQVRLYDGRTLELLQTFDLEHHNTAVVPTGVGIGGWTGRVAFWAAVPIFQWTQTRSAIRSVAQEAASAIAEQVQPRP